MPALSPAVERAPATADDATHEPTPITPSPLRRINDVAAEVGLTTRAIRYYEEQRLLTPSARSSGAYRLYDAEDIERLRAIKAFRDDAGFSLAEIATLLDDETARQRNKSAFLATDDEDERQTILVDAMDRLNRQLELLDSKIKRLTSMRRDVAMRADRIRDRLDAPEPNA
jgi:DNA-binding transcriptional MerR regulator